MLGQERESARARLMELIARRKQEAITQTQIDKQLEHAGREKRVFSHDTLNNHFGENPDKGDEQPELILSPAQPQTAKNIDFEWNAEQLEAITAFVNKKEYKEHILIGAAGTGKTTCVKEVIRLITSVPPHILPRFRHTHKTLPYDAFAFACVSYTNRAVRNMRRVLPPEFSDNCLTIHKLLEYFFEFYEEFDKEKGEYVKKVHSIPARNKNFPLTGLKVLIIDEASMCGLSLWGELYEALPEDCRILFLGDLQQLPPVYDSAILGYKISWAYERGKNAPHLTELTQVYRQALENPILAFAHQVLKNEWKSYEPAQLTKEACNKETPSGSITFKCFPQRRMEDTACLRVGRMFREMIRAGQFDTENDVILIPFNKKFGTIELNKHIAQELQELRKVKTYEILSGYFKHYFCVGDRVLFGKYEGTITSITRNGSYFGTQPTPESLYLTRWGTLRPDTDSEKFLLEQSEAQDWGHSQDLEKLLNQSNKEDAKRQASHIITLLVDETGQEMILENAGDVNKLLLAYAITVHKSQGAEWKRVFFILHHSHFQMLSRELLYTGVTRAREELIVICEPDAIEKGIRRQRIPGHTLKEKAEFFKDKQQELQKRSELESLLYA